MTDLAPSTFTRRHASSRPNPIQTSQAEDSETAIKSHETSSSLSFHSVMRNNRNHLTRGLYCDLMVALYNDGGDFAEVAEVALIKNIEDPNELIKAKLLSFWSDTKRLPSNPTQRLIKMMQNKSMFESEQTWIKTTVWLMLDLIRALKLSDEPPLDDHDLHMKMLGDADDQAASVPEESKSQGRRPDKARALNSSQPDDMHLDNSLNRASFGQTLEWSSSFQKDSRFYKVRRCSLV